ncbi:MAG: hypothetical protein AAFN93_27955 [Bacteroidota bacterium]
MKKRKELEKQFNEILAQHELILRFNGDNEITITGAPKVNLASRLVISVLGILLVSACLVIGQQEGLYNTMVIGGSLLGLILITTPFINFYSKKFFEIFISRRVKQINITRGIARPYKRIDFSDIDAVFLKKEKDDDFINPEEGNLVSWQYTFGTYSRLKSTNLIKLESEGENEIQFVEEFGQFLADFIKTKLVESDSL